MLSAASRLALTHCRLPAEALAAACSTSFCHQLGLTAAWNDLQHHVTPPQLPHHASSPSMLASLATVARHSHPATPRPQTNKKPQSSKLSFPRNDQITAPQVRVVLPSGETKVMDTPAAVQLARSSNLDLVQTYFDPNKPGVPPVAKIVHFGAFIAEQRAKVAAQQQQKKEQEAEAAKVKSKSVKEIRFNVQIGDHDLETKLRRVGELLDDGHKVMLVVNCKRASERQPAEQALEYILVRLQKLKEIEMGARMAGPRAMQCLVKLK